MIRPHCLTVVALIAVASALWAQQPGSVPIVGVLRTSTFVENDPSTEALKRALRELGYVEGRNIKLVRRFAEGQLDRLPQLAQDLVQLKVDVILEDGRLLDPKAQTEIDGVLIRNQLDGSGFSVGTADIKAQFIVRRDGAVRFDKVKSAHHEWESSFVGANAIPAAAQNYPVVVQKLVSNLFADPDFIAALKK